MLPDTPAFQPYDTKKILIILTAIADGRQGRNMLSTNARASALKRVEAGDVEWMIVVVAFDELLGVGEPSPFPRDEHLAMAARVLIADIEKQRDAAVEAQNRDYAAMAKGVSR